jgi:CBS domain containing-hemolysin-like protein
MILGVLLVVILIVINAFFVAAEFALVKVRYSAVEADVATGNRLASVSQAMLDRLDAYLSAAQIGITLASLALGWVGEPVVAEAIISGVSAAGFEISKELAHKIAVPVGFIIITVLHLVFGEAVPKYAAISHPQAFTYACALPLKVFAFLTAPLVWVINAGSWLILTPLGIRVGEEADSHTEEEIRLLLAESARSGEQGSIQKTEHELIEKVFAFDERVVRQIMVPRTRMVAVDVDTPPQQIFETLVAEGYSRMPVFSGTRDHIVGVLHSKDLLRRIKEPSSAKVSEYMRAAFFVPETKKIRVLLRELQAKRIHMAIVVDEFGVTSGLVTLEDIVEELVGEIQDEYDDERPVVETKKDGSFVVNGHASIIDVNAHLPVPLPESTDYSTVAGLLNVVFSGIPEVGQTATDGEYVFTVLTSSRGSVDSVRLARVEVAAIEEQ